MLYRESFEVSLKKGIDFINITEKIEEIVEKSEVRDGLCHIFLPSTTAGLIINENDPLLIEDIKRFFRELVEEKRLYHHPSNAHSHLRALLTRKEKVIPIKDGKLVLGTWQSILLFNFDVRARKREVIVTVIGE